MLTAEQKQNVSFRLEWDDEQGWVIVFWKNKDIGRFQPTQVHDKEGLWVQTNTEWYPADERGDNTPYPSTHCSTVNEAVDWLVVQALFIGKISR